MKTLKSMFRDGSLLPIAICLLVVAVGVAGYYYGHLVGSREATEALTQKHTEELVRYERQTKTWWEIMRRMENDMRRGPASVNIYAPEGAMSGDLEVGFTDMSNPDHQFTEYLANKGTIHVNQYKDVYKKNLVFKYKISMD